MLIKGQRCASLFLCLLISAMAVSACTKGKESFQTEPVTPADKQLNCEQLQMEMNDADYVIRSARHNRGFRARNILWPFGYPATYLSASEAIEKAEERIDYLSRIYDIKQCGETLYESPY